MDTIRISYPCISRHMSTHLVSQQPVVPFPGMLPRRFVHEHSEHPESKVGHVIAYHKRLGTPSSELLFCSATHCLVKCHPRICSFSRLPVRIVDSWTWGTFLKYWLCRGWDFASSKPSSISDSEVLCVLQGSVKPREAHTSVCKEVLL